MRFEFAWLSVLERLKLDVGGQRLHMEASVGRCALCIGWLSVVKRVKFDVEGVTFMEARPSRGRSAATARLVCHMCRMNEVL